LNNKPVMPARVLLFPVSVITCASFPSARCLPQDHPVQLPTRPVPGRPQGLLLLLSLSSLFVARHPRNQLKSVSPGHCVASRLSQVFLTCSSTFSLLSVLDCITLSDVAQRTLTSAKTAKNIQKRLRTLH